MLWLLRTSIVALYPSGGALPGAEACGLDAFLVKFRRESPPSLWAGAVLGALVFQLSPLFTVFVPLPAALLPTGLLDRHAERITGSSLYLVRQALFLLKVVAGLCWGTHPEIRRRFALPTLPADPGTWRQS